MSRDQAHQLYEGFHKYGPKKRTRAPASFRIPKSVKLKGKGVHVLYRSRKFNPITYANEGAHNYIHDHKAGVNVYFCDGSGKKVPSAVARAEELVYLGKCLGFAYKDAKGKLVEYECDPRSVEWYAVPNPTQLCPEGHALLVVEKKQKVVAMIWGGKLRVEPRGIVG